MRDSAIVQRLTSQVLEPVTDSIAETRRVIATEISRATGKQLMAQSAATSAARSSGAAPRQPSSRRAPRTLAISASARSGVSGAVAKATSLNNSTEVPPSPNITIGPNTGSRCTPMMVSTPPETMGVRKIHMWTSRQPPN